MKRDAFILLLLLFLFRGASFAQNVFDPTDSIVLFDPAKPPARPANTITKWVKTVKVGWNTNKFKSYYFNNMAFRLRYPNGYNPNDTRTKYPVILFMHGGGEIDAITNNDYQLYLGAQLLEQKIDSGLLNAFLLFPQAEVPAWDAYFSTINNVLDSLEKYCHTDPDRLVAMGLSMGGFSAVNYARFFPQRTAMAIGSSPALIQALSGVTDSFIQIPLWLASGIYDGNPSVENVRDFLNAFLDHGGKVQYNPYPVAHESWDLQWAEPNLVPDLKNAHKANPLIYFNRSQFPADSPVNAKIGLTPGYYSYQWQKDGREIAGAVSNEITATAIGTYKARFKRTANDDWSEWSYRPAVLSIAAPDTIAPSAPGNLRVLSTTTNSIQIGWDHSSDNIGVASYDIYQDDVKKYSSSASNFTVTNLNPNTTYRYAVKATDFAGNSSSASNGISVKTKAIEIGSGLKYKYYEGDWNSLPDFLQLTPVKTGTTVNVEVTPKAAANHYGFIWEGFLKVPAPGYYSFEIVSDDGSRFYFNNHITATASPLINDDGVHDFPISMASTVNIPAGVYPVAFSFFTKDGPGKIDVYWTGPDIPRQLIPATAYVRDPSQPETDSIPPTTPAGLHLVSAANTSLELAWDESTDAVGVLKYDVFENGVQKYTSSVPGVVIKNLTQATSYRYTVQAVDAAGNRSPMSTAIDAATTNVIERTGLNYKYYEGDWSSMPDFYTLTPVKTGFSPSIDPDVRNVNEKFGIVWSGYLNIPAPGYYSFELVSDDGSRFYFNTTYGPGANPLINNDGIHEIPIPFSSTVNIPAGVYPVSLSYFNKSGAPTIQLYWSGPGIPKQLVPSSAFVAPPDAGVTRLNPGLASAAIGQNDQAALQGMKLLRAYPNPISTKLSIEVVNTVSNLKMKFKMYNGTGQLLQQYDAGTSIVGKQVVTLDVSDKRLFPGLYIIKYELDGKPNGELRLLKAKK